MAKDVKIEVLYYKTATDISLEFGLHGNYPLRLLSSNCDDIDSLFRALKRAVSRSEIIITVGGFDHELPRFIARAIKKECIEPDYKELGIIAETKYRIPQGSDPLSSKSKRFGGFLIESGPQTIISLVDDRKIRLDIVKEFLVDYITEHHKVFNTPFGIPMGRASSPEATEATVPPETPSFSRNENSVKPSNDETVIEQTLPSNDEPCDISDEAETCSDADIISEQAAETPDVSNSTSSQPVTDIEDNASDLTEELPPVLPETDDILDVELELDIEDGDETDSIKIHEFDSYSTEKYSSRRRKRIVRLVCLVLSLLVIIGMCTCMLICPDNRTVNGDVDYYSYLGKLYSSFYNDPVSAFEEILSKNNTFTAWLDFRAANVYHPVMSVSNPLNSTDYMTSLPDGTSHAAGSLITKESSGSLVTLDNIVIYGNASAGGIFESLALSSSNSSVNSTLTLSDDHYSSEWTVFSTFTDDDNTDFYGILNTLEDPDSKLTYIHQLQQSSLVTSDIKMSGNEALLILVGINGNKNHIAAALLSSVKVLSGSKPVTDTVSSEISSSDSDSSLDKDTVSEEEDITGEAGQTPDTPDIILPPLPSDETSSDVSSTEPSKVTSTEATSSKVSSSAIASSTQSHTSSSSSTASESSSLIGNVSSNVSSNTSTNTSNTSTNTSTGVSSVVSSSTVTSSSVSSSEPAKPAVDPMYTWDITLYVKDKKTGTLYEGDAVDIVAMIIEIEMSPTIDPKEAVKAQAVAAYNWLLNNGATKESTAPTVSLDKNTTAQAKQYAAEAKGMLVMYGNTVAKTNYYAYSAGMTANTQDIWGGTAYPYLQSVDCSVDKELKDFITTKTYTSDVIKELILEKCGIDVSEMPKSDWIKPLKYDQNNLYCLTVSIGGKEYKGAYLRSTLLEYGIRSTAYTVAYNEADDSFTFTVKGYGHGVGMSQRGAKAYAKQGWTCEQILTHFFTGTTVVKY